MEGVQAQGGTKVARKIPIFLILAAGIIAGTLAPILASAHSYKLGDIAIGHVWAPPLGENAVGMPVYGPILNRGDTMVQLVGASTPIAEQVRFRTEKGDDERWPEAITLQPGKPIALARWREHMWLSGLNMPLKKGDSFDLTLDFGEAGKLTVRVVVEKASGH